MSSLNYIISGRVQGVGFRAFVVRQASRFGITGWVKNESDGTVVCLINSPNPDAQAEFEAMLHKGPRFSKVTRIEVMPSTNTLNTQVFEVRY